MTMTYYYHPASSNCRKVTALIEHLGIEVERRLVDLPRGAQRAPEFLALNPNGRVPALVDGELQLWESNAIMIHLAEDAGSDLWPADGRRIHVLKWLFWEQAHFMWATGIVFFQRLLKPMLGQATDEARVEEGLAMFGRLAAVADAHLAANRHFVGEQLTLADLAIGSDLGYADAVGLPLAEYPELARWYGSLCELPAWQASQPPALG